MIDKSRGENRPTPGVDCPHLRTGHSFASLWLLAVAGAVVMFLAPAVAQDSGTPAGPNPEDDPENIAEDETVWELSLVDCQRHALQDNFTLKKLELQPRIAAAERSLAEAQFDWILGARTEYRRSKDQSETSNAAQAAQLGIPPTIFNRNDHVMRWDNSLSLSHYFPTGTTATFAWTYNKTEYRSDGFLSVTDSTGVSLTVTQALLKNLGPAANLYSYELAAINVAVQESRLNQERISTLYNVESAFWNLVFTFEDLKVTANSTRLAREDFNIQQRRKTAGLGTQIDVVAAKARLKNLERELFERQRRVRDASDQLLTLIAPAKFLELAQQGSRIVIRPIGYNPEEAPDPTIPPVRSLIQEALRQREELRQAILGQDSARLSVDYRENQKLPDLNAFARFGFSGVGRNPGGAFKSFGRTDQTEWSFGLELSVPLGNIEANNQLEKARLQQKDAEYNRRLAEVTVISEVLGAVRQFDTSLKTLDAARVSVDLAQQQVNAADERLKRGLATRFEVDSFRNALDEAQREALSAWIAVKVARALLARVTGSQRPE